MRPLCLMRSSAGPACTLTTPYASIKAGRDFAMGNRQRARLARIENWRVDGARVTSRSHATHTLAAEENPHIAPQEPSIGSFFPPLRQGTSIAAHCMAAHGTGPILILWVGMQHLHNRLKANPKLCRDEKETPTAPARPACCGAPSRGARGRCGCPSPTRALPPPPRAPAACS